jgi:ammonia channel protein AmtB
VAFFHNESGFLYNYHRYLEVDEIDVSVLSYVGSNFLGCILITFWVTIIIWVFVSLILKNLIVVRAHKEEEILGMDSQ